ncbi:MAG: hypothetical protein ACI86H_002110 [bacterium]|jgi:hypothetical protein
MLLCFFPLIAVSATNSKTPILLETIGVLSSQNLYLSYISIGTTVDGYSQKIYKPHQAKQLLTGFISFSKTSKKQLHKVLISKILDPSDTNLIKDMLITHDLLIQEAQSFQTFIETPNKTKLKRYHYYRSAAWGKISKILKLKKK